MKKCFYPLLLVVLAYESSALKVNCDRKNLHDKTVIRNFLIIISGIQEATENSYPDEYEWIDYRILKWPEESYFFQKGIEYLGDIPKKFFYNDTYYLCGKTEESVNFFKNHICEFQKLNQKLLSLPTYKQEPSIESHTRGLDINARNLWLISKYVQELPENYYKQSVYIPLLKPVRPETTKYLPEEIEEDVNRKMKEYYLYKTATALLKHLPKGFFFNEEVALSPEAQSAVRWFQVNSYEVGQLIKYLMEIRTCYMFMSATNNSIECN